MSEALHDVPRSQKLAQTILYKMSEMCSALS